MAQPHKHRLVSLGPDVRGEREISSADLREKAQSHMSSDTNLRHQNENVVD